MAYLLKKKMTVYCCFLLNSRELNKFRKSHSNKYLNKMVISKMGNTKMSVLN